MYPKNGSAGALHQSKFVLRSFDGNKEVGLLETYRQLNNRAVTCSQKSESDTITASRVSNIKKKRAMSSRKFFAALLPNIRGSQLNELLHVQSFKAI